MKVFLYLLLIITALGCKKITYELGENRLPKATERGRGIFACYIDGDTYIARRQDEITYNSTTGYLYLENSNAAFQFRLFVYEGVFGPGDYVFDVTGEEWIVSDYSKTYGINSDGLNRLQITNLNLDQGVVSGNFDLDLINEIGDSKLLRDGRFDLEMNIIN